MQEAILYAIVSVILVSLTAVIGIVPFLARRKVPKKTLIILLSVSVGVLLGTVFFDFMPEIYAHGEHHEEVETPELEALYGLHEEHGHEHGEGEHEHEEEQDLFFPSFLILFGFLSMFIVEKMVHYHHSKRCESPTHEGHSHAYSLAPVNLIGDGVHNFVDGLIIAGSYIVSIPVGIATSISIALHELPQEVADVGVLLYSGVNKRKALLFNFFSGITALVGTIIGIILSTSVEGFTFFIIPFAAGNFLYIAASNLLPQLHRHCGIKDTVVHLISMAVGIALIVGLGLLFPHTH